MGEAVSPVSHHWEGSQLIVSYPAGVTLTVSHIQEDKYGSPYATVTARTGEVLVNMARLNLLDQRQRIDFHVTAHARDGQVDWQALLVPVIALVQRRPEPNHDGEHETTPWTQARPAPEFLATVDAETEWLIPDLAAPGSVTGLMAPRGLGKTHIAHALMIAVATGGSWCGQPVSPGRVLLIDRDNSPREIRRRLRAWGGRGAPHLRILTRDTAPDLQDAQAWAVFPFQDYELVVLDSIGAATERITETDTGATGKALAHLLDLARKGPAVLLLGNTVKSAVHYRGSGTWADRMDILYEVRDATDFTPSGQTDWWQELPEAGEAAWGARAARRKQRNSYRLALVPSKFRIGEEPEPFCLEISLGDPWSLRDVTSDIATASATARTQRAEAKRKARAMAADALSSMIIERAQAGEMVTKGEAEALLSKKPPYRLTRREARELIDAEDGQRWCVMPGKGSGRPLTLRPVNDVPNTDGEKIDPMEPLSDKHSQHGNSAAGSGSERRETSPANPRPARDTKDEFSRHAFSVSSDVCTCGEVMPEGRKVCFACRRPRKGGVA